MDLTSLPIRLISSSALSYSKASRTAASMAESSTLFRLTSGQTDMDSSACKGALRRGDEGQYPDLSDD